MTRPTYLLTGDRNWADRYIVDVIIGGMAWMQRLYGEKVRIIHGGAKGLDNIAGNSAKNYSVRCDEFPADWEAYGRKAGPVRNQQMLEEEPKVVFAFHDDLRESKGTLDMCIRAASAGVPVYVISHADLSRLRRFRKLGPRKLKKAR